MMSQCQQEPGLSLKKMVCISAITSCAYDTHPYRGKLVAHLVIHNIKWSAHSAV